MFFFLFLLGLGALLNVVWWAWLELQHPQRLLESVLNGFDPKTWIRLFDLREGMAGGQEPQYRSRQWIDYLVTLGERLGDPNDVVAIQVSRLLTHSPEMRQLPTLYG